MANRNRKLTESDAVVEKRREAKPMVMIWIGFIFACVIILIAVIFWSEKGLIIGLAAAMCALIVSLANQALAHRRLTSEERRWDIELYRQPKLQRVIDLYLCLADCWQNLYKIYVKVEQDDLNPELSGKSPEERRAIIEPYCELTLMKGHKIRQHAADVLVKNLPFIDWWSQRDMVQQSIEAFDALLKLAKYMLHVKYDFRDADVEEEKKLKEFAATWNFEKAQKLHVEAVECFDLILNPHHVKDKRSLEQLQKIFEGRDLQAQTPQFEFTSSVPPPEPESPS